MNYEPVNSLHFSLAIFRYPSGFSVPTGTHIYIYILKNLGKSGGFEMKPNKLVNLSVKDLAFWG